MDKERIIRELQFRTSRSSGPGGQHANKNETRVEAIFNVDASQALGAEEKARIKERLASRITKAGEIVVAAQHSRSQAHNRVIAASRLLAIIEKAARPRRKRKKLVFSVDPEKRLEAKKRHALKKALRKKPSL